MVDINPPFSPPLRALTSKLFHHWSFVFTLPTTESQLNLLDLPFDTLRGPLSYIIDVGNHYNRLVRNISMQYP